jgi:DNA-binding GntR family transcriptional regulator
MPLVQKKIVPSTLRQQIAREIRQSILQRELLPGERLIEREISSRFGTSLTVVREALIQLEAEGLITKRPNATTNVVKLDNSELENIYAVRSILEHYAFQQAARRASDENLRGLEELYDKTLSAAKSGDGFTYVTADLNWHGAGWHATENSCLADTLKRVIIPLFGFSSITITPEKRSLIKDAESHRPLLDAIRAHDPVGAGKAYRQAEAQWRIQYWPFQSKQ